jgi:hypothetical protein
VRPGDADASGDGGGGQRMIAGDDDDADSRGAALGDGVGDALPGRIEHGDQAGQVQIVFRVGAAMRGSSG